MPLITVEHAVEAVKRCSREMLLGQVEVIVDAIRAIQPHEPSEAEVERVAMALTHERVGQVGGDPRETWLCVSFTERDTAETLARAAIAAMSGGR